MDEAQIEAIARAYCRKLGLDPDLKCYIPSYLCHVRRPEPVEQWYMFVGEVVAELERQRVQRNAIAMQEAIAEVQAATKRDA